MKILRSVFENNRKWAESVIAEDPDFFTRLSKQQRPEFLWIGCSDSRVPANQIAGMMPGELFVHRNIANVVVHTDINCLSVIQYAVDVLKIKHIIVCGHYGCGGIQAALENTAHGLIDNWLCHVRDIYRWHQDEIDSIADQKEKVNRLCELNVKAQVLNICQTTIVQNAWASGQNLSVHGWIYSIENGLLKDMDMCITNPQEVALLRP
jgi:carbonic anhydrase